jgi:hypothetical protein
MFTNFFLDEKRVSELEKKENPLISPFISTEKQT